jgi:hypothetical protein
MVLLDHIVETLDLAEDNGGAMRFVIRPDGGRIGLTPIDGDGLGHAMAADGLGQEAQGRPLVPLLGEEKVNGLAALIHGTIQVG